MFKNNVYREHNFGIAIGIAILTLLLVGIGIAQAETVVYSEDFETDNGGYTHTGLLDQWQWGIPTFANGPSAHSGNKVWGTNLAGNVPRNSNSYLTSPAISIPILGANQIARIRFFGWISVDEMLDRGEFQVSSDGVNWITKGELFNRMSGEWTDYYFDVSNYAGGNIYLRFRLNTDSQDAFSQSSYNMAGLYIDDVAIIISDVPATKTVVKLNASEDLPSFASCPWVYTWNGTDFEKDNDVYSTARGQTSEYRDYYTLDKPLISKDGKYLLQLKENDEETSYTNFLQLITVDHPSNVNISSDDNGNILTYSNPSSPLSATDDKGNSVLNQISTEDGLGVKVYNNDSIVLDFSNLDTTNGATLVLRTIGFQMDDTYGNFTLNKPYIYIQTQDNNGNWVTRNQLYPRSNWTINAYNLREYLTTNKLVRLYVTSCYEGVYHIIDYVGLDTSPQQPTLTNTLSPVSAIHSINGDVLNAIDASDNKYATMNPTENISIAFNSTNVTTDNVRDFVLVSEGYYVSSGTYFIYTWDGSKWAQRDGWSIEGNVQSEHNFDLSQWLPDPNGEYKIRIWQDYWYDPAAIDYVGITQNSNAGTMLSAYDLRKSLDVTTQLSAADGYKDSWGPGDSGYPCCRNRNRWVEVKWTGLKVDAPPTTNPVSVTNTENLTPTISWAYNDAEGDSQKQYQVEVWTGAGGTGTNEWNNPGTGATTSVMYAGNSLVGGKTYYVRVRAFDGSSWGGWSETSWIPFEQLISKIKKLIAMPLYNQPYLLDPNSFDTAVGSIWMLGFDKSKADEYDKYYYDGIYYRSLRLSSLTKALAFAKKGEATKADEYLNAAEGYRENADISFGNAYNVYESSLTNGIFVAKEIRDYSQIAFKAGVTVAGYPAAGQALDGAFIVADWVIDRNIDPSQANKDALTSLVFLGITEGINFPELGNQNINDYLTSRDVWGEAGKDIFPAIQLALQNNNAESQIIYGILKQAIPDISVELSTYIGDQIKDNIIEGLNPNSKPTQQINLHSPGELRVYDSNGNVTGLVMGKIIEDIPNSIYDSKNKSVTLLEAKDTYRYEVVGTDTGEYGLDILSVKGIEYNPISLRNTIIPNEIHQYTVDWNNFSKDKIITLNIDSNNDGIFDKNIKMQLPTSLFAYTYLTNQHVNFDGSSSKGNITSYKWDFGDGTNASGKTVGHTYREGDYAVTLTVENDNGGIDSRTRNIRIDLTPPTTTATLSGTRGNNNRYISDVQINLTATDNESGSGINNTKYSFDNATWNIYTTPFNISNAGTTTLYYYSIDNAGNIEPIKNIVISIEKDNTPPTTTATLTGTLGNNGWYVSGVEVNLSATDNNGGSGVNTTEYSFDDTTWTTYINNFTVSTEGTTTVYYRSTDNAGNIESTKNQTIKIDKTPPQITINIPANGSSYILNLTVLANWSANDSLSGIASVTATTPNGKAIDTATVGNKTFSVNATDNAGNQASKTATYNVVYNYSGILPPINASGSSNFKLGSTVPVKLQLWDANGNNISTATARIYLTNITNGIVGKEINGTSTSNATIGNLFRYDSISNQYIFNLATKPLSIGTWRIRIELDDGTSKYATIGLKP